MAGGGIIPTSFSGFGGPSSVNASTLWKGKSPGELIPHRNFTYHSIGELESLVLEHQTL